MDTMELKVGDNVRKIRELKGFSQDFMAKKLGISQRSYSSIESENKKIDTEKLKSIAEILEVSVLDLFTFDDRVLFNNTNCTGIGIYSTVNQIDDKRMELYESQLNDLREEMKFLKDQLRFLQDLVQKQFGK